MEIKIKCPTCSKVLKLLDAPNINSKTFKCPTCGEKHVVGNCQRIIPKPKPVASSEETQYGPAIKRQPSGDETRISPVSPRAANGDETQIAGMSTRCNGNDTQLSSPAKPQIGTLADNYGRSYQLLSGINTIGRKANSSPASMQIDTDDKTMSRNHAVVEVRKAGGQFIHILKNGANKNPSFHNGVLIGPSDQLILNNGDRLRLGNTELTFKK